MLICFSHQIKNEFERYDLLSHIIFESYREITITNGYNEIESGFLFVQNWSKTYNYFSTISQSYCQMCKYKLLHTLYKVILSSF